MSVFNLNQRRWLFCMTHPDDEISICIWIKRLVENGNEVFISWTHSNAEREAESRKVSELLGIAKDNLFFHEATDGHVASEFTQLLPKFRDMIDGIKPDVVACGAFEQGHPDHDTTNVLVNSAFSGEVLEIPFYHTYAVKLQRMNAFSDPTGESTLELTKEEVRFKRNVAKQFRSQNIWWVLFWFEVWQSVQGRRLSLSTREVMRLQTHKLFRLPNHPDSIAKQVERSEIWQDWCSKVLPHLPH